MRTIISCPVESRPVESRPIESRYLTVALIPFMLVCGMLAHGGPVFARDTTASGVAAADAAEDNVPWAWKKKAMRIRTLMASESWEKGHKRALELRDLFFEEKVLGVAAARLLAETTALQAEAELGLGHTDDARWNWRVAQALSPGLGGPFVPSMKPMARRFFDRHLTDPEDESFPLATEVRQPPVPLPTPLPEKGIWPTRRDTLAAIDLELLIDETGRVRYPIARGAQPMATPLYKLLEAVRVWRFTPARTEHGDPISVRLALRTAPWASPEPDPSLAFAMRMARIDRTAPVHRQVLGGRPERRAASSTAADLR